jgi:mono/diheme cytochrome c family protein
MWTHLVAATAKRTGVLAMCLLLVACGGGGDGDSDDDTPPAPTITLAAPSGTSVNRTVPLTATATASGSITRVEFIVDGTVIANVTAAPYTTNWDTSTVTDGAHTLTARVTDAANAVVTSAPVTVTVTNAPTIAIALSDAQVFPPTNSTATGSGEMTFNLITGAVTGGVTLDGIAATVAHIHNAIAGTNGPILVDLVQNASNPNRWDAEPGGQLTAEQINDLLAGKLYVNVHTPANPGGEIRGQIIPAGITLAIADLNGASVTPPVTTTATGFAAATVDQVANRATVHVNTAGADDADAAHVHIGAAGENATAALLTLTKDTASATHWLADQQAVTTTDRDALTNNRWYVDVHTPGNPGGLLRGQLSLDTQTSQPPPPPPPPVATVTLAQLQQSIFTPTCSGCHTGGGSSLPGSMNLSNAAATYAALVGVASTEIPSILRVTAGDPDNSYLVDKIEGSPGIVGSRMPQGGAPLSATLIANVRTWIAEGAQNN